MNKIKRITFLCVGAIAMALTSSCKTQRGLSNYDEVASEPFERMVSCDTTEPVIIVEGESDIKTKTPASQVNRQIIFVADIYLLVDSLSDTMNKITMIMKNGNGYMQSMSSNSIIVRIPSKQFQNFMNQVEQLGKTTDKNIQGKDVTEKMMDLNIRLDNADKLRKRYAELLEKGEKVEDILKIEKALGEITERIERMKGQIRFMKNRIAFSTVTIHLNSSLPQKQIRTEIPIKWVRDIGSSVANTNKYRLFYSYQRNVVDFDLPSGFMKLSGNSCETTAMSPDGIYLAVTEESNHDGGTLEFWTKIITKSLEKKSAFLIKSNEALNLNTEWPIRLITAEKTISNQKYSYNLAIVVYKDELYLYEVWGSEKEFKENKENIIESIKSIKIGTFLQILFSPSLW